MIILKFITVFLFLFISFYSIADEWISREIEFQVVSTETFDKQWRKNPIGPSELISWKTKIFLDDGEEFVFSGDESLGSFWREQGTHKERPPIVDDYFFREGDRIQIIKEEYPLKLELKQQHRTNFRILNLRTNRESRVEGKIRFIEGNYLIEPVQVKQVAISEKEWTLVDKFTQQLSSWRAILILEDGNILDVRGDGNIHGKYTREKDRYCLKCDWSEKHPLVENEFSEGDSILIMDNAVYNLRTDKLYKIFNAQ